MAWPVLFAVVALFYGYKKGGLRNVGSGFEVLCLVVLAFVVGFVFALLPGLAFPTHWVQSETIPLASLRNGGGAGGTFFLGTGAIGSTEYYLYYKKVGQGYRPGKIEVADNITVFEEERGDGELRVFASRFESAFARWAAINPSHKDRRYEFVIPRGGLVKKFEIR